LQDTIDIAKSQGFVNLLIAGDFNADSIKNKPQYDKLSEITSSNNLDIHINEPTRVTDTSSTCLDQFLSNLRDKVSKVSVLDQVGSSDHYSIAIELTLQIKLKCFKRLVWNYNNVDHDNLCARLSEENWDECFDHNDMNDVCQSWTDKFLKIAHACIPNQYVCIRPDDKPFYNSFLRKLKRQKERARKKAKRVQNEAAWLNFRKLRNNYNKAIVNAKESYNIRLCNSLGESKVRNTKCWWSIAKTFMGQNKKSHYPPLVDKEHNTTETNSKAKCKLFNDYFLSHSNVNDNGVFLPPLNAHSPSLGNVLTDVVITEQEVLAQLRSIDTTKSTGPDNISPKMLKLADLSIVPSLTRLFNLSLTSESFPDLWKKANVLPLFKKDDAGLVENYRPVSLLSCVSKLFERIMFKNIFNFIQENNIISPRQSGFTPGDSTVYQLTHLYHLFSEALNNKKDVRVTFCDITKAFDRVWHTGLLFKLEKIGIVGQLQQWFKSYLNNRQQKVIIEGFSSDWGHVNAGVPQGSVLGPLLFLIYINDICDDLESEVRLFADDTTVYVFVDDVSSAASTLNSDLIKMSKWAEQWLVRFNSKKTKTMLISLKKDVVVHPPLLMDGSIINDVNEHKHLGITLQSDLNWQAHINSICKKANKRIDILSCLKYRLDRRSLETIYISYIRPILEYGSNIWDNCTKGQSDQIESIQKRAARIVTGALVRTSTDRLYSELAWHSLKERRRINRLCVMHKILLDDRTPNYLKETLPGFVRERSVYPLRNRSHLSQVSSRIELYHSSFFPRTINEYNNLDDTLKLIPSNKEFRKQLSRLEKSKTWYYVGDRKLSIIYACLRLGCSQLKDDLYTLNIINDNACWCGTGIENAYHFFFECTKYINQRQLLFSELMRLNFPLNLNFFLFGNDDMNRDENVKATFLILDYIKNSNRFQ
jgi:hypothetical protein